MLRPHHWERWRSEREEVMAEMKARMEAAPLLAKLPDHLVERSRLARTRLGG